MKNKYGVIIYWSDEDQLYIAEVPELPGCATHGDTQSAALRNAKEAIQLWVKTAKEFGNPVPEPTGRRLSFNSTKSEPSVEMKRTPAASLPIRRKNHAKVYYDAGMLRSRVTNPNTR